MVLKYLITTFSLILLNGCATLYKESTADNSAEITIIHQNLDFPSSTEVTAYSNSNCLVNDGYGRLAMVGTAIDLSNVPVSIKIKANERIFISFNSWEITEGYFYRCATLVSFIPLENHSYIGYQSVKPNSHCNSYIVNKDTKKIVSSLTEHKAKKACIGIK